MSDDTDTGNEVPSLQPVSPEEFFLMANANPEYISQTLSQLTRRLMRASISFDHGQIDHAVNDLNTLVRLISHTEKLSLHEVVAGSVKQLNISVEHSDPAWPRLDVVQNATQYLIEASSSDGFAMARLNKSWERVEGAISSYDQHMKDRRFLK